MNEQEAIEELKKLRLEYLAVVHERNALVYAATGTMATATGDAVDIIERMRDDEQEHKQTRQEVRRLRVELAALKAVKP